MTTIHEVRASEYLAFVDRMKVEGNHITRVEVIGNTGYKATVESISLSGQSELLGLLSDDIQHKGVQKSFVGVIEGSH